MAQHVVNTTTELQQKNEILEARKISPLHFLFPLCEYPTDEQIKLKKIVLRLIHDYVSIEYCRDDYGYLRLVHRTAIFDS